MSAISAVSDHDFSEAVLARSRQLPVLVDFWAPWCGPCRMLAPVLERLAPEYADRVVMVKLDTDENPATAQRFEIRGIPAVKLYKDGAVIAEFAGAQPEPTIRAFLDKHCQSPAAEHVARAREALERGDLEAADRAVGDALAATTDHPGALIVAARVAYARGQLVDAAAMARLVSTRAREASEAHELIALVELAGAGSAGLEATAAAVAAAPDDLAARYAHAAALVGASRWREALDELLAIVQRDRKWNAEAARKAMLVVFAGIGMRDPLSERYRRKLMLLL